MSSRHAFDALIFDYDGVIADTETMHWRLWAEILERRGIQLSWEHYCRIGRGIQDVVMLGKLQETAADPAALSGARAEKALHKLLMREMCTREPPIAEATIAMLRSIGDYRIGLVTSSAASDVLPVLRAAGIDSCFHALVFGEDVEHHKPAPDPYLLIKSRLGIIRGLAFEDSDAGILSAQRAELMVVAVTDPGQLSGIVYQAISDFEQVWGNALV
jgi:HAD superfamily hydrolase (TIGR01509 family)